MLISDLSYLSEISEENVVGGDKKRFKIDFKKDIDVDVDIKVDSDVDADGAFNELAFDLYAFGRYGSGTEVQVEQVADADYYYNLSYQKGSVTSFAE